MLKGKLLALVATHAQALFLDLLFAFEYPFGERKWRGLGTCCFSCAQPLVSLRSTVQRDPGTESVHVIPPMNDFSVFNRDDRNESVMIGPTTRKDRSVNLVFKDDGTTILRTVDHQRVA